jgi:uncharacterized membrane protein
MAEAIMTALRFLHISSAIALVGGATLWATQIMPSMAQLGPTLPRGALPTIGGKVAKFLPNAALLTLLTGAALYWLMQASWGETWRLIMQVALGTMIVVVAISFGVMHPTFKKLSSAMTSGPPGPPPPEAQALMGKMKKASMLNLALGWFIVVLMVVGTALRST